MRVVAFDLGSKRIGVAVSDRTGTLASPYEVVRRCGDRARDHRRLRELVDECEAERVVVGLPLSLDGSVGPAARLVLDELPMIEAAVGVPIETFDERLTTVTAHQLLAEQGIRAKGRREIVDKAAAAVLLQTWLESPAGARSRRTSEPVNDPVNEPVDDTPPSVPPDGDLPMA